MTSTIKLHTTPDESPVGMIPHVEVAGQFIVAWIVNGWFILTYAMAIDTAGAALVVPVYGA